MKLCNFLRFDPTYTGKGLRAGGLLEENVWNEFANDHGRLAETAAAIRARVEHPSANGVISVPEDDEDEFAEGKVLFRAHRSRERNRKLVKRRKKAFLRTRTGAMSLNLPSGPAGSPH